ncbi:transcriptional regulator [Mycolicibacterium smegmatis]|uniref:helix-turn-helix domain-containing protein n=1 Tax=Mycolicibacterium smegmatis TaxID=1772 RepID=UPI001E50D721|nr:helix-turn-helix domain-containing protein [Mycolicibacterium smegmatis]UGU29921.1 transcriptional regulator [Mycolicibacterium smegmatis]ULN70860.1 transcriptional regulator [Mycolicibacterium smegmatis]
MARPAIVGASVDLARHARLLSDIRDAVLSGQQPPRPPRPLVARSWERLCAHGISPDDCARSNPVSLSEVENRRSRSDLRKVLPELRAVLGTAAASADFVVVIADNDGIVLWRDGAQAVRRTADQLGFVEGASWAENEVGTNAIGTALLENTGITLFSAEHYALRQHSWYCIGEPVRDPRNGDILGVIDISGPALTLHPSTAGLAHSAARLAEAALWRLHRENLDRLCEQSAALLANTTRALVVDDQGWVACARGVENPRRIAAPSPGTAVFVPGLGLTVPEPLDHGWILRPHRVDDAHVELELDLGDAPRATIRGEVTWTRGLSPRHAQILRMLAQNDGHGVTATDLSIALYGNAEHTVAIRSEISRLRKRLGAIITGQPYRFSDQVVVRVLTGLDRAD